MDVVLAARNVEKLRGFAREIGCDLVQCDSSDADQVKKLFIQTDKIFGDPSLVIYNPSARIRGDITSLDPQQTKLALETTCFGAFLVAQQAAVRMITKGSEVYSSQALQPV